MGKKCDPVTPKRFPPDVPRNPDLSNPSAFGTGSNDPEILIRLGRLVVSWTALEEQMIGVFAKLMGADHSAPVREVFRSIINQREKIKMMRHLLERLERNASLPPYYDFIIDEFERLNAARNGFVHGLWWNSADDSYLSKTEPGNHPFHSVTRKVKPKELQSHLDAMARLSDLIVAANFVDLGASFPADFEERLHSRLNEASNEWRRRKAQKSRKS